MIETRKLRVFLCHSSQDKPIVRELYQRLNAEGWIDPWLDQENLLPGQDWNMEIEKAVEASDAVIVFLTKNSVNKEGYVQRELKYVLDIALEKPEGSIFIIPIRFDECNIPRRLRSFHYLEWSSEINNALLYGRLVNSLKKRSEQQIGGFEGNNIRSQEKVSTLLSAFLKTNSNFFNDPLYKTYTITEYTNIIQKLREIQLEAQDSDSLYDIINKVGQGYKDPLLTAYLLNEIVSLFEQFQNLNLAKGDPKIKQEIIDGLYKFEIDESGDSNPAPLDELEKRFNDWKNTFSPGENK